MTQTSTIPTPATTCPQCSDILQATTLVNGNPALVCDGCTFVGGNLVLSTDVTADLLRTADLNTLVVVLPLGKKLGNGNGPTLAFGLGSFEGDFDGFAEWLRTR